MVKSYRPLTERDLSIGAAEPMVGMVAKTMSASTLHATKIVDNWKHPNVKVTYSLAHLDLTAFRNSGKPKALYEKLHCARGDMENRIPTRSRERYAQSLPKCLVLPCNVTISRAPPASRPEMAGLPPFDSTDSALRAANDRQIGRMVRRGG